MNREPSPALRLGSAVFVLAMAIVFAGAGCGAGASTSPGGYEAKIGTTTEAMPPPPPPAPARLETVSDAEALLANGEYDIRLALGPDKLDHQGQFAQPPAQRQDEVRAAEASDRKPKDAEGKAATATPGGASAPAQQSTADSASASASPCVTACKALASMDRATSHICSLAGNEDSRCTNARERVRSATERVRQNCSDCGS